MWQRTTLFARKELNTNKMIETKKISWSARGAMLDRKIKNDKGYCIDCGQGGGLRYENEAVYCHDCSKELLGTGKYDHLTPSDMPSHEANVGGVYGTGFSDQEAIDDARDIDSLLDTSGREYDVGPPCGRNEYNPMFDQHKHYWREDGTCSYCGSVSADMFFDYVNKGGVISATDKNYKVYLREMDDMVHGCAKFYFQHLNEKGKKLFIDIFHIDNINMEGAFCLTPYFIGRASTQTSCP